jgi:hypothetical protein
MSFSRTIGIAPACSAQARGGGAEKNLAFFGVDKSGDACADQPGLAIHHLLQ